jgi:hypothetical protein
LQTLYNNKTDIRSCVKVEIYFLISEQKDYFFRQRKIYEVIITIHLYFLTDEGQNTKSHKFHYDSLLLKYYIIDLKDIFKDNLFIKMNIYHNII